MTDRDSARFTRRRFLGSVGVGAAVGLAGCAQSGSEGSPETYAGEETPFDTASTGPTVTPGEDGHLPAPALGPADAEVTVMTFEDYACPHCAEYSLTIFPAVKSEYIDSGQIRYEFHDFPIPVSQESARAASAARAVQDTVGNAAYWEYSKSLFENQNSLSPDTYADLAGSVGADPETVRTAAVETAYSDTVQADRDLGDEMGITGTPGIFVNGGDPLEEYGEDTISQAIEDALP